MAAQSIAIQPERLPFVSPKPGGSGLSFWDVPQSGGFLGGCETGMHLARIYLKYLRKQRTQNNQTLQCIVLDMFDCNSCDENAREALEGQIIGLFSELETWLIAAAHHLGKSLDSLDEKDLLAAANDGLHVDNDSYLTLNNYQQEDAS